MKRFILFIYMTCLSYLVFSQQGILVLQTDFGVQDGAVAAMKGVAMGVSPDLKIFDLTHEIPPYNIWEAAYRLQQTAAYWPKGTVFISVVDPGVGSSRKSVVVKTKSGQFFVTPDNGTISLVAQSSGVEEVRVIDEKVNRLKGSGDSYTFHGRDVFAYTGARLAAGKIHFQQVGPLLNSPLVTINYLAPVLDNETIKGIIPILDVRYGNVWTNIPDSLLKRINLHFGDSIQVVIYKNSHQQFSARMPFVRTFSEVLEQQHLAYINSLMNLAISINQGNFAAKHAIQSGPDWRIEVRKLE